MKLRNRCFLFVIAQFLFLLGARDICSAQQTWSFQKTYESKTLLNSPFFLFTTADINRNGKDELIVTDFGLAGNHGDEWKQWKKGINHYNLMILEWENNELKSKFQKSWDTSKAKTSEESDKIFIGFMANQLVSWKIGDRVVAETIPAIIGVEWTDGKYMLLEQNFATNKALRVGSWVFSWLSASCYVGLVKETYPQECLVGIRDFSGKGEPKIVTILEKEIGFNQYKQMLRVRKFGNGFPIEWSKETPRNFSRNDPIDSFYQKSNRLLLSVLRPAAKWYFFEATEKANDYRIREIKADAPMGIVEYDMRDVYLRSTQKRDVEEYWGYHQIALNDPDVVGNIFVPRRVTLNTDFSDFIREDINFSHHDHFLGVGYFIVEDIDGDGLDEIILVEETAGKLTFGEETVYYGDIKDYIHVLKWDGSTYRDMWVSPPYTKRGTKLLVDDIKNAGKKQLVVLTPYGTVQIWERQ